ncbi:AmmeMemoRadiSam system protein A [Thiorhodovibrio winogradskyi]|nr:AmmeMemoRadiSam system protein A [Thiorhodovibrio winogradskyi]
MPSLSGEAGGLLAAADRQRLLAIARAAIAEGLGDGRAAGVDPAAESPTLQAPGAAFVTLELQGQLRGCIGSLEPRGSRSLAADVRENAQAAAFRDPRFPPLQQHELAPLHISISVIGPREPLACASESDLLAALSPGVDGLILEAGTRRGTFLPSVWEQLPRPADFLRHLKRKAGLADNEWPQHLQAWCYRTQYFGE